MTAQENNPPVRIPSARSPYMVWGNLRDDKVDHGDDQRAATRNRRRMEHSGIVDINHWGDDAGRKMIRMVDGTNHIVDCPSKTWRWSMAELIDDIIGLMDMPMDELVLASFNDQLAAGILAIRQRETP